MCKEALTMPRIWLSFFSNDGKTDRRARQTFSISWLCWSGNSRTMKSQIARIILFLDPSARHFLYFSSVIVSPQLFWRRYDSISYEFIQSVVDFIRYYFNELIILQQQWFGGHLVRVFWSRCRIRGCSHTDEWIAITIRYPKYSAASPRLQLQGRFSIEFYGPQELSR